MKISVSLKHALPERTISDILVDGEWFSYVLEDKVREVKGKPVSEWKIQNKTAMPSGSYDVTLEDSPRFGKDTITIKNVPGFTGVRCHGGNSEDDTEGCPLPGFELTDDYKIKAGTSGPAVASLKMKIRAAIVRGEKITWEVTR